MKKTRVADNGDENPLGAESLQDTFAEISAAMMATAGVGSGQRMSMAEMMGVRPQVVAPPPAASSSEAQPAGGSSNFFGFSFQSMAAEPAKADGAPDASGPKGQGRPGAKARKQLSGQPGDEPAPKKTKNFQKGGAGPAP